MCSINSLKINMSTQFFFFMELLFVCDNLDPEMPDIDV